jgi:hypothetical protein
MYIVGAAGVIAAAALLANYLSQGKEEA